VGAQSIQNTALEAVFCIIKVVYFLHMFGKLKNLIISIGSLLVIVAGVMSVLVVLGMVTIDQLVGNMTTLLQISVIVLVAATTLILLLRINRK